MKKLLIALAIAGLLGSSLAYARAPNFACSKIPAQYKSWVPGC
jgi:hypothetical protein